MRMPGCVEMLASIMLPNLRPVPSRMRIIALPTRVERPPAPTRVMLKAGTEWQRSVLSNLKLPTAPSIANRNRPMPRTVSMEEMVRANPR